MEGDPEAPEDGSGSSGSTYASASGTTENDAVVVHDSHQPALEDVPEGTSSPNTGGGPATRTRSQARAGEAFAISVESPQTRGDAAAKLLQIRQLVKLADDAVQAVAAGHARAELVEEEVKHDLNEMKRLQEELLAFPVDTLSKTWRASISRKIAQKEAALATARVMLENRLAAPHSGPDPGGGTNSPRGSSQGEGGPATTTQRSAGATRRGRSRSLSVGQDRRGSRPGGGPSGTVGAPGGATNLSSTQNRLMNLALGTGGMAPDSAVAGSAPRGPRPGQPSAPAPGNPASCPPTAGAVQFNFNRPPPSFPRSSPTVQFPPSVAGAATSAPAATTPPTTAIPWARPPPAPWGAPGPSATTLAAPSWKNNPGTPYTPSSCKLGPDYYLSFPYPWDSLPESQEANVNSILKVGSQALPRFSGDRRTYVTWRNSFLPGVHLKPIDVSYKIMLLRSCMVPSTARMREFIDSIVGSPEGYRQAVITLEDRYGGSAALLMTRQEALLALPEVKEGEFRLIETLHSRLGTFLLEWEGITGAPLSERESLAYYLSLMGKVEHSYSLKYLEWVENHGLSENLKTFHDWLSGELKRHRRADVYGTQRVRGTGRTGGETSRPPRPSPPSGTLDRNFPKQRTFLAAWEEENQGEDVPVGEGEAPEEEVQVVCVNGPSGRAAPRPPCSLCSGDHGLGQCNKFKELDPRGRKEILMKENRCFLCLQRGHTVARCKFTFKCARCERRHHTLLHGADAAVGSTFVTLEEENDDTEGAVASLQYGLLANKASASPLSLPSEVVKVSLRTLPVLLENPTNGAKTLVNAMLDDGCTSAAILSKEVAKRLNLQGQVRWTSTEGVGGHVTKYQTVYTCIRILNADTRSGWTVPAQVMDRPAGSYEPVDWNEHKSAFPHLATLPFPKPVPDSGVDVMIGNLCPMFVASREEVCGADNEPVARRTFLGWTAVGPTRPGQQLEAVRRKIALIARNLSVVHETPPPLVEGQWVTWEGNWNSCSLLAAEIRDKQLTKLLQRMLDVEDPGEAMMLSPREEYIVKQARRTLLKQGEQYQIGCTWAPGGGRPPLARRQAEDRLRGLEGGKYFKDPAIKRAYQTVIDDWEREGFVKRVPLDGEHVKHLLPHFPILKQSETTPVRPVMDCSTQLNKHLLAGPNLLNEVPDVLLRFRSGLYSFSGDVKQMFLRIFLPPEDRPYHCFLWRGEQAELQVYQFQVHVFGNAGSPFLAVFVVKEHARTFQVRFPVAVETIVQSTLIDDILDSADTVAEARTVLMQVRNILSQAGMTLAKAHSNSLEVLRGLEDGEVAKGVLNVSAACNKDPNLAKLKALGLSYDPRGDQFTFALKLEMVDAAWTKRKVLRTFPRLFDPLGLILPFTMVARAFFSLIAREEYAWDAPLLQQHQQVWERWLSQLPSLEKFVIPRCVKIAVPLVAQLHLFSDASSTAFAAVAYLRCEYGDADVTVRLVAAKAHVAPAGRTSIPRLELLAADLSVKLRQQVSRALKVGVQQVFHWTDSTSVLYWLRNEKQRLQLFVYNKVRRIQQATELGEWHWTPTTENPADLPSRGCSAEHLMQDRMWLTGPAYLAQTDSAWPVAPVLLPNADILGEMKKEEQLSCTTIVQEQGSLIRWERFGSWEKLRRTLRRIFQWRDRARTRLQLSPLPDPHRRAEAAALLQAQLPFERTALSRNKNRWENLGFFRLRPFRDGGGIWRGEGRLRHHKHLPPDVREPVLLTRGHPLARLLLLHYHEQVLRHAGGVSHVLARFHARYWLPNARAFAFSLLKACVACKRRMARPQRPPEGPLPLFRLPPTSGQPVAFGVTAVDCAGPFRVKRGRAYETYYLLLITCCHVRAVRLECLSDLSVDAFLLALTRATARGVQPHTILSDNGGNFDGANRLLRALWAAMPQEELEERKPEIKWRFNPPYASHYGGVFERLIKAAKEALYHVLPSHLSLTLEELLTAFAVVEGVLNTRPLAYTSTDGRDFAPLTPNHFLYGSASEALLLLPDGGALAKRWSGLQKMVRVFLRRFHQEVRPHLQLSQRLRGADRDLTEGDVVVFFQPSSDRKWPLARVIAIYPGSDGRVRTVDLRTAAGREFRRDVGEVAVLFPADQQLPQGAI